MATLNDVVSEDEALGRTPDNDVVSESAALGTMPDDVVSEEAALGKPNSLTGKPNNPDLVAAYNARHKATDEKAKNSIVPKTFRWATKPLLPETDPNKRLLENTRQMMLANEVSPPQAQEEMAANLPTPGKGEKVLAGTVASVEDTARFFTSPLGIATLGIGALPKLAQRTIALAFAAQMGKETPEIARQLGDELGKPDNERDYQKIGNLVTTAVINTAFTAAGAMHGLAPEAPVKATQADLTAAPGSEPPLPAEQVPTAADELLAALRNPFKAEAKPAETAVSSEQKPPIGEQTPKSGTIVPEEEALPLTEPAKDETTEPGAAAGTRTGQNEQIGSDAPEATSLASAQMPAEVEAKPGTTLNAAPTSPKSGKNPFFLRARSDGVPDILDSIQELGGIKPPGEYSGGEYDGYREAMVGPARTLINKGAKHGPDTIIDELKAIDAPGAQRLETADDLWDAITAARKGREALRKTEAAQRTEAKQVTDFQRRAIQGDRPKKESGTYARVPVDKMHEGDTFAVQKNSFVVKHLEFDPDGNLISVTVKDGDKFGVQRVDAGEFIHVDKGSFQAGPEHDAGLPPELAPAAKREIPSNKQLGGKTSGAPLELKETPTAYLGREDKLDEIARDIYGRSYETLSEDEKGKVRVTLDFEDSEVQRRKQPETTSGREPAPEREQPGEVEPAPRTTRPVREARAKAAEEYEALAQEIHRRPYGDLFPSSQKRIREIHQEGRRAGETFSDPIETQLRQLSDHRDRLFDELQYKPRTSSGEYRGDGVRVLNEIHYIDGKLNILGEIARAPAELKSKWMQKLLEGDAPDAVERTLDKLIAATDPLRPLKQGRLFEASGGLPKWATETLINSALKIVRAAYKGGKKLAEAIQEGVAWLRDQNLPGFNEDEAHAALLKAADAEKGVPKAFEEKPEKIESAEVNSGPEKEKPAPAAPRPPKPYDELKGQIREADEKLREAIRLASRKEARVNAGKTLEEARAEKNLAAARYRSLRDQILSHPDYIRDLLLEQDAVMRRLRPGPGKERPTGQELTELELRAEDLQNELSEAPKKLVGKIADDLFYKGRPTESEKTAAAGPPELKPSTEVATPAGEELGKDMPGDRFKRAVMELPVRARDLFNGVLDAKRKIGAKLATMPNRDLMAATKDASDNRAMMQGKQTANFILHELNRAFGATADRVSARNEMREYALTFVVESGRNLETLRRFRDTIHDSQHQFGTWAKRALNAIDYAEHHWDRFQKVAELYEKFTDAEVAAENESGIATLHRSGGYVFHLQDVLQNWALPELGGGGGPAAPFKHIREHATYADAIANGVTPKSLNAVDLLQRRVTLGRKLVNHRAWTDSLARVIDPKTQLPIVTDTINKTRADGTADVTAPPGYAVQHFAGQTIAVHKGYDGLFDALTGQSWFSKGTIRPMLMKAATTSKHLVLVFDSYHLGRMAFWNAMVRGTGEHGLLPGNPLAYKRGLTLLDASTADIREMATRGEIPKEWADNLLEDKRQLNLLVDSGYNVGHSADNIHSEWIQKIPLTGDFNHWLFQKYVRGAMAESGLIELRRQIKMNPGKAEADLARQVARDLNTRFGNLNNQSWIKSPTGRDLARLIVLAPSWNESLIRSEIGAVKQLGMAPVESWKQKKLSVGTLGRAAAVAVIGQFIANQIINYSTRGHPTWENKEEGSTSKLSAYIPDVVGNGPGFFLNPLVLPMEMTDLFLKKTERTGDATRAVREIVSSRLNTFGRAGYAFVTRESPTTGKLRDGKEVAEEMATSLVPVPLSFGTVGRAGKQLITRQPEEKFPGQFQRQAFQTFGVKLDSAPNEEQRIKALATNFNDAKGIKPNAEFYHGDYYDLDRAILIGNENEIQRALADLLQKKTAEAVQKHYEKYANAPYTGQLAREAEFKATLDPEQLQVYDRARERRQQVAQKVQALLKKTREP